MNSEHECKASTQNMNYLLQKYCKQLKLYLLSYEDTSLFHKKKKYIKIKMFRKLFH